METISQARKPVKKGMGTSTRAVESTVQSLWPSVGQSTLIRYVLVAIMAW
jgi:hypothetical protein